MNAWLTRALELIRQVAAEPRDTLELALMAVVAGLVFVVMMKITGKAVQNERASFVSNVLVLVLGTALVLAAAVAADFYVVPLAAGSVPAKWILLGGAGLAFLLLAVPLVCLFQRTQYLSALLMLAVSVALGAMAATLARSGINAVRHGEVQFDQTRERTEDLNRLLDK